MTVLLTVVVPTVAGREHWLARCLDSYERTLRGVTWNAVVLLGRPTCAHAWNEAMEQPVARYVHLTADDIEAHDGWLDAGIRRCEEGTIPAARILNGDGTLQSCGDEHDRPEGFVTEIARIPLLPAELAAAVFPIPELHYYSDNLVSDGARRRGWETVVTRDYLFTHHLAREGRVDSLLDDFMAYRHTQRIR